MSISDLITKTQYVIDSQGEKQAVLIDLSVWAEIVALLEDLEDAAEMEQLRLEDDEAVPWEQAKEVLSR